MYKLQVLKLEKTLFDGMAKSLLAKSTGGDLEVLSHHANLITPLKESDLKVVGENGEERVFAIKGGILEVTREGTTVLCD